MGAHTTRAFAARLLSAIEHLDPQRECTLIAQARSAGVAGGLKACIAHAVGMRHQSQLSDILAGRTPGWRYRQALAEALGVARDWLERGAEPVPCWTQPARLAFESWANHLHGSVCERAGVAIASSASLSLFSPPADAAQARLRREYAEVLALPLADPLLDACCRAQLVEVPFERLEAGHWRVFQRHLEHGAHLRRGQTLAAEADRDLRQTTEHVLAEIQRYLLPPELFALARRALRQYQELHGEAFESVADILELLWRQELDLRRGTGAQSPPEDFEDDTGRGEWSPWTRLQRHEKKDIFS